jgi:hypothetical protein
VFLITLVSTFRWGPWARRRRKLSASAPRRG